MTALVPVVGDFGFLAPGSECRLASQVLIGINEPVENYQIG